MYIDSYTHTHTHIYIYIYTSIFISALSEAVEYTDCISADG